MREIKNECMGGATEVGLSPSEAVRGWYRCPQCQRILNIREKKGDGWPVAYVPRHSTNGPKDMTELKRRRSHS